MTNVIIVNEKDEVIGSKPRDDRNQTDIIRVSGLLVFNPKGEVLLSRRGLNKINDPGKWGPSVAGTVEEGETYASNIIKEAKEEIGLEIDEKDLKVGRHSYQETSHKYFSTQFSTVVDKPISDFVIQKEEVEEIRWVSIPDLLEWFNKSPNEFLPSFSKTVNLLKSRYDGNIDI